VSRVSDREEMFTGYAASIPSWSSFASMPNVEYDPAGCTHAARRSRRACAPGAPPGRGRLLRLFTEHLSSFKTHALIPSSGRPCRSGDSIVGFNFSNASIFCANYPNPYHRPGKRGENSRNHAAYPFFPTGRSRNDYRSCHGTSGAPSHLTSEGLGQAGPAPHRRSPSSAAAPETRSKSSLACW
jgi:hypothetical protein